MVVESKRQIKVQRSTSPSNTSDPQCLFSMLRTLLTPISARFSSLPSPQTANKPNDNEVDPEDFARDVLVELMRNSIDRLKDAQDAPSKLEVLVEIHRIIQEDSCTKDAFRELDGFLLLINALSTLNVGTPPLPALLQQIRLIFMIMSEAMKQHPNNSDYFSVSLSDNHHSSV